MKKKIQSININRKQRRGYYATIIDFAEHLKVNGASGSASDALACFIMTTYAYRGWRISNAKFNQVSTHRPPSSKKRRGTLSKGK